MKGSSTARNTVIRSFCTTRIKSNLDRSQKLKLKALYHSAFAAHEYVKESRDCIRGTTGTPCRQQHPNLSMATIEIMADLDTVSNVKLEDHDDEAFSAVTSEGEYEKLNLPQCTLEWDQSVKGTPPVVPSPTDGFYSTHMNVEQEKDTIEKTAPRSKWPLTDILEPGPNDCLFGRGGGTNHHVGNKLYRKMVEDRKEKYLSSKRLDKPLVAMEIINEWRSLDPPGRFLKQNEATKLWFDVGDKKAREKTSQALREKNGQRMEEGFDDVFGYDHDRETRFESGTQNNVPHGHLARDHSLGTEIIDGRDFSMEGFSWDEMEAPVVPPCEINDNSPHYSYVRENSLSQNPLPGANASHPAQNPFGDAPSYEYYPPPPPHSSKNSQYGPHHLSHHIPTYHGLSHPSASNHSPSRRRHEHSFSSDLVRGTTPAIGQIAYEDERTWDGGYNSQASPYYGYPPPPGWRSPHPHYHATQIPVQPTSHSAFARYNTSARSNMSHPRSSSGRGRASYEAMSSHHLSAVTEDFTKIANLMSEDNDANKNSVERSNSWAGYEGKRALESRESSIGSFPPYDLPIGQENEANTNSINRSKSMPYPYPNREAAKFPSPPHPTRSRKKPEYVEKDVSPVEKESTCDSTTVITKDLKPSLYRKLSGGGLHLNNSNALDTSTVCRPEPIKRDTSNQSETLETKRSIKRVVLSRDRSAVSRSLKEEQRMKGMMDDDANMRTKLSHADLLDRRLSVEINKLGLDERPISLGRMTTEDVLHALIDDDDDEFTLIPPHRLSSNNSSNSADALELNVADDRAESCEVEDALSLILEDEAVYTDEDPSAVNEHIAAKWINGETSTS